MSTVTLDALGILMNTMQTDMRALKRQMTMLQAGQSQIPNLDQFQAGLTEIDVQVRELGNEIAKQVTDAIGDHLTQINDRLTAIEKRLP
jgi:hypothetical protein